MLYAVQKNGIRFFLSPQEDKQLFANFRNKSNREISIEGHWLQELKFTPIVYDIKPERPKIVSYPVESFPSGVQTLKSIIVPFDSLNIPRTILQSLKEKNNILSYPAPLESALIVCPTRAIPADDPILSEKEIVHQDDITNDHINQFKHNLENLKHRETVQEVIPEPIIETVEAVIDMPIKEESPIEEPVKKAMSTADWGKMILDDLNSKLANNPEIIVTITDGGKSVKLSRKVKVRRQIV